MPGYEFRRSGRSITSFGRTVDTYREDGLARRIQADLAELAYRTGHTADPELTFEGSYAVVYGTDPNTGLLTIGFNPEFAINEAVVRAEQAGTTDGQQAEAIEES